jgi:hypothetical protein
MEDTTRLKHLINLYLDGGAGPEELAEFDALLARSPQAADAMAAAARFEVMLEGYWQDRNRSESLRRVLDRIGATSSVTEVVENSQQPALSVPRSVVGTRSPVFGFLHRMLHIGGESPVAAALMWLVMAIFLSGTVMTVTFIAMMMFGVKVRIDQPVVAKGGEQEAGSGERGAGRMKQRAPGSVPPALSLVPVARLIRMVDCRWDAAAAAPETGDDLLAGRRLALTSGLAEIIFQGGARTLLEGPATLEIRSRMGAYLQQGKFTVTVENPLARGFEVRAPGMKYTDLGTEFGVLVAANGQQEVHVFRGTVQAEADNDAEKSGAPAQEAKGGGETAKSSRSPVALSPPLVLSANQGLRVAAPEPSGKPAKPAERIDANAKEFVRTDQINQIAGARSPEFSHWKKYSDDLCKRPDLLAYYDFQSDDTDRKVLHNRAASGKKFDGRLVGGAKWCEGRLAGKQAIEFVEPGSGARVDIPVDCKQLTLVAWIKKPAIGGKPLSAILDSDDFRSRPGAVHWQFSAERKSFYMDVSRGSRVSNITFSDEDYDRAAASSSWCMYAETFDAATLTGGIYFNGKPVARKTFGPVAFANIGQTTIGGYKVLPQSEHVEDRADRTLGGQIDELMVFNSALSQDQIERVYSSGAPPK